MLFTASGDSCLTAPTTLVSGEDFSIEVAYAPDSETGQHETNCEIISDAPSSPDQVQLSGHLICAIPVPINCSAMLVALAMMLLLSC